MKLSELTNIFAAVLILTIVIGFSEIIKSQWSEFAKAFLFAVVIITVAVSAKKLMAYLLDSDVEHRIWSASRYWFRPQQHLSKEVPLGIVFPLFISLFTLGVGKVMTLLTYETKALKVRAAKRFGYYSFTEMTEFHNGLIGAAGIVGVLLVSFVSYFPGLELLSKMAAYYAFFNMIPIANLDGAQIFFGSRVLYVAVGVVTLIFAGYATIITLGLI